MHTGKQGKQTLKDVLSAYLMPFPAANTNVRSGRCRNDSLSTDLWFLPYKGLNTLGLRLSVYVYTCHVCMQGGWWRQVKLCGTWLLHRCLVGVVTSLDEFAVAGKQLKANYTHAWYLPQTGEKHSCDGSCQRHTSRAVWLGKTLSLTHVDSLIATVKKTKITWWQFQSRPSIFYYSFSMIVNTQPIQSFQFASLVWHKP